MIHESCNIPSIEQGYRKGRFCQPKKNAQHERCELSFIGGKMKTIAREIAIQIALRNYFSEVWGKVSVYVLLVKGEYMQSNKYFLQKVSASHEESASP